MSTTFTAASSITSRITSKHTRADEMASAVDSLEVTHSPQLTTDVHFRGEVTEEDFVDFRNFADAFGVLRGFALLKAVMVQNTGADAISVSPTGIVGMPELLTIHAGGSLTLSAPDGYAVDDPAGLTLSGEGEVHASIVAVGNAY
jgi:hypothetical protein